MAQKQAVAAPETAVTLKERTKGYRFRLNLTYILMLLPALIMSILFHDVPMAGIIMAFKNYNYREGIFGSPWCGLENFKTFFETDIAGRLIGNTMFYSIAGLLIVNIAAGVLGALLLYEIRGKYTMKVCQTATLLPNFISIIAVTYMLYLVIAPDSTGILNMIRNKLGMENIDMYNMPQYWRAIPVLAGLWMNAGMAALYNYGALLAVNPSLYEAATLDGANWWQRTIHVSLPGMSSMICMTIITQCANIMASSLMQYHLTMGDKAGSLGVVTDVIATFTYLNREGSGIGSAAAIGLFTSAVGAVLVILSNLIIKKIEPEKAMF